MLHADLRFLRFPHHYFLPYVFYLRPVPFVPAWPKRGRTPFSACNPRKKGYDPFSNCAYLVSAFRRTLAGPAKAGHYVQALSECCRMKDVLVVPGLLEGGPSFVTPDAPICAGLEQRL